VLALADGGAFYGQTPTFLNLGHFVAFMPLSVEYGSLERVFSEKWAKNS
jgi:hypothetical protein